MAALAQQDAALTGLNIVFSAADVAGDTFANNGKMLLVLRNTSGTGDLDVRVDDSLTGTPEGASAFDPDVQFSAVDGAITIAGPFPTNRFDNPCEVTYPTGVTGLEVAVVRF